MRKPADAAPVVPSVSHAVAILRLLAAADEPLGVNAVARRLRLSPSSCFNILKTLAAEDLIGFDLQTKRYRIGLGVVDIARQALGRDAVVVAARPVMRRIALDLDAAVGLWRMSGIDRVNLIELAEGESATRIHMAVGQRQPAAGGASGRALMAGLGLTGAALREAFDQVRWQQPPRFEDYIEQLEAARRLGYAVDIDALFQGLSTVAAAILNPGGGDHYCLSVSVFSARHGAPDLARIGETIAAAARQITDEAHGPD